MRLRPGLGIWSRALRLLAGCALVLCGEGAAQQDSATVTAGARYRPRSDLHARLLGDTYRSLWTTPIRVPVLDLASFAGGLTPVRSGGHKQTRALRFRGADGREYNFRSVDKELTPALPDYAQETVVDWLRQDLTSAQLPVAPVVASPLLDSAGILNPGPRLVVLPDDPRLGEFRAEFAGMLGTLEVHADEGEDGQRLFADAVRVAGTETLLEHLEEDPAHRVDARAFLKARLMDVLLGDYDRHEGQWRWARFDHDGLHVWVPVPEDRDYAFVDYAGLLPALGRLTAVTPRIIRFTERYPPLLAMLDNSLGLTRRLLAELERPAWDSVAAQLQGELTDAAIEAAVRRMPRAHYELSGPELVRKLQARRDRLPQMAADFYRLLSGTVEVHGTDEGERAEIVRASDGSVEVRLLVASSDEGRSALFRRTFHPDETEEVRIFLHGGDDHALATGAAGEIRVRVIGGGGDDRLEDASGGPTLLYDARGENRFVEGPRTHVSRRPERESGEDDDGGLLPELSRDWGHSGSIFRPAVDWRPHAELVIGGGPAWTRYAFRRSPYATRLWLRGLYAPLHGRFGVEAGGDFRRESSPVHLEVRAHATALEATAFYGLGNASPPLQAERARVWQRQLRVEPLLRFPVAPALSAAVGGVAKLTDPEVDAGAPVAALHPGGSAASGQLGARAELHLDTRDDVRFPRNGVRAELSGAAYPDLWEVPGAFARFTANAAGFASLPFGPRPVLAVRAGGAAVLGDFPFHEAAFLGGSSTLRGYRYQRFAGDHSLHGGTELRVPLTEVEMIVRGRLGVSLFGDAGRVYHDGESPGGWHTATGASLWFTTPLATATLSYARGEENRLYLQLGTPF